MSEDIISHITSTKNTTAKNIFINATHIYKFSSGALSLHLLALTNFFCKVPYSWKLFYPTYKKKVSHYTQLLCTEKSSVQVNRSIFWHRKSISGYEKLLYADDKMRQFHLNGKLRTHIFWTRYVTGSQLLKAFLSSAYGNFS